jgi:hypothetical protein
VPRYSITDSVSRLEQNCSIAACRQRADQSQAQAEKAEREKVRRNKLHAKFMELSQLLDPGRPPKTDKASILTDAVRVIGQLRSDAEQLKDSNMQLRTSIKELKVGTLGDPSVFLNSALGRGIV